jgi:hypothetical protein
MSWNERDRIEAFRADPSARTLKEPENRDPAKDVAFKPGAHPDHFLSAPAASA